MGEEVRVQVLCRSDANLRLEVSINFCDCSRKERVHLPGSSLMSQMES